MIGYKFGENSTRKLATCHSDLQKILRLAISRSKVDFGVSEGYRSKERQYQLYLQGKSKIDGYEKEGKHNKKPSEAVDIFAYHPDLSTRRKLAYDKTTLSYIAGLIDSCAKELYDSGQISNQIRWGANWDSDGVIDYDQNFDDYPHFELIKPRL
ncbi:peptidoglycan LD-endopeptidase CwlK [Tenacibaculum sp. 190524A02b]|uniref:Peptidoglycan LD-endopeptidase CwlK n=1 Tax=Tenacibaculum vairaonense TaxID=3137860 RepID=A0ABP1FB03_9FLAO